MNRSRSVLLVGFCLSSLLGCSSQPPDVPVAKQEPSKVAAPVEQPKLPAPPVSTSAPEEPTAPAVVVEPPSSPLIQALEAERDRHLAEIQKLEEGKKVAVAYYNALSPEQKLEINEARRKLLDFEDLTAKDIQLLDPALPHIGTNRDRLEREKVALRKRLQQREEDFLLLTKEEQNLVQVVQQKLDGYQMIRNNPVMTIPGVLGLTREQADFVHYGRGRPFVWDELRRLAVIGRTTEATEQAATLLDLSPDQKVDFAFLTSLEQQQTITAGERLVARDHVLRDYEIESYRDNQFLRAKLLEYRKLGIDKEKSRSAAEQTQTTIRAEIAESDKRVALLTKEVAAAGADGRKIQEKLTRLQRAKGTSPRTEKARDDLEAELRQITSDIESKTQEIETLKLRVENLHEQLRATQ